MNYKAYPWRRAQKPWHGLVAEVLLQRTRAATAARVYELLVSRYPKPLDLARAPTIQLRRLLGPLGLRWRVPLLKALAKELDNLGGNPPTTYQELIRLPAIGPYAASAYLGFHAKERAIVIDANIVRWICRLVGERYDGETRRKKWLIDFANRLTPQTNYKAYNYAALDFSMTVCRTNPECSNCPIGAKWCAHGRLVLGK